MRDYRKIVATACLALCLAGCSKSSGGRETVPADLKKLGVIVLAGQQPYRCDLGGGRTAVITPAVQPDGRLDLEVVIEMTDAAGNVRRYTKPHVSARPGQKVTIAAGDVGLEFTPQLKAQ